MSNNEEPIYAYCELLQENVRIFPPMRPEPDDEDITGECLTCGHELSRRQERHHECPRCEEEIAQGYADEIDDIDPVGNYYDNDNDFDIN